MIHPDTKIQYINDQIGYGVIAKSFIPKGTITYIKDDLELNITPEAFDKLDPLLKAAVEKYSYIENQGNRILSWDHGKYVNHCCDCNTMSTGYDFEIAIRDIYPGEEITDEYGLFNSNEAIPLVCSKVNCRKIIHINDIDLYFESWDQKVKSALAKLMDVKQVLLPFMEEATLKSVLDFLRNQEQYKSVRNLKIKKIIED